MINKIVSIPEGNIEKFEKIMNKLTKLSAKLGSGNVEYKLIKQEVREVQDGKETVYVMFNDYEISGEAPTINGYSLVAILERQKKLNLINHIDKSIELPNGLQEQENYCEHCNSNRARKYLFILQEQSTGKFIQVGKSCVKDFTGSHNNPEMIADFFSYIQEVEESEEVNLSYGNYTMYVESLRIIAFSSYFTDKEGYIKKIDGTMKNPSTVSKALNYYKYTTEDEVKELGYFEKAVEVKEWIMSQKSNNDYILNLQALIQENVINSRKAGFLASAYASYKRTISKQQEQKRVVEAKKDSQFVGNIGDRVELTLKYDRKISFYTQFGDMTLYFFHDENDNVYVWKTNKYISFNEDKKITMKATFKDHNEYNGIKQNVITRCASIVTV